MMFFSPFSAVFETSSYHELSDRENESAKGRGRRRIMQTEMR
jgi:hypothetical protein